VTQHTPGVRLSELVETLPLGRSSVFEVIKALEITTSKLPGEKGQGGGRVAWLSSADADRVKSACHAVHRGEMRIAELRTPPIDADGKVLGLDLSKTTLPDAIAAMVEAWYQAQEVDDQPALPLVATSESLPDLTLPQCCERWGVKSRNSVKARARALGVDLIAVSRQCTVWPGEHVGLGDALAEHLKTRGNTLADFQRPTITSVIS
jgi:predicted DNA-binding transcriptional regulator AlpA